MRHRIDLTRRGWELARAPRPEDGPNWADAIPAAVPGNIVMDLHRAGLVPEPFFGENFRACKWAEEWTFWYRLRFTAGDLRDADFGGGARVFAGFDGIDTFAEVFLNGVPLGTVHNMYRRNRFDITPYLETSGTNELVVRIDPPLEGAHAWMREHGIDPETLGHALFGYAERLVTRKAPMSYGWDQAPCILAGGIFRRVYLEVRAGPALEPLRWHVADLDLDRGTATLHLAGAITPSPAAPCRITVRGGCGQHEFAGVAEVPAGAAEWTLEIPVADARFWWPNGMGAADLYETGIVLTGADGAVFDEYRLDIGIRTIRVVSGPPKRCLTDYRIGPRHADLDNVDGAGLQAWDRLPLPEPEEIEVRPLNFEVNGRRVFIKGFDWQNPHALFGCETDRQVRTLVRAAESAHANMIRVWGGGAIEIDAFYAECSRRGLLVWQDFYFACAVYPRHKAFLDEIRVEAADMVERLRNHACIACWCGDNESDMAEYDRGGDPAGNPINKRILPETLRRLDPQGRYYHPSSPSGGPYPRSDWGGDKRNWGPWEAQDNYRHVRREQARFISESGCVAYPSRQSVERFLPERFRFPLHNRTWRYHRGLLDRGRCFYPDDKIDGWLAAFGGYTDLDEAIEKSQFAQAWGEKLLVDCCRQRKYECGGILLWKIGACWPCVDLAVVDFYLEPLLALAYIAEACKPVAVSFTQGPDTPGAPVEVFMVNDERRDITGTLTVWAASVTERSGRRLYREAVTVPADASHCFFRFSPTSFVADEAVFLARFSPAAPADGAASVSAYSLHPKAAYDFLKPFHFELPEAVAHCDRASA